MTRKTMAFLSFACAAAVGNIYFAQPMLVEISQAFAASAGAVSLVATMAQVGYGLGVLLLVPLGDMVERRGLIVNLLLAVGAGMACSGAAARLEGLCLAQFAVGLTTVTPQILIPYAATLAAPAQRATVIGAIQSALLIGILLARTAAGAAGSIWGWRAVFYLAAVLSLLLALCVRFCVPPQPIGKKVPYRKLLASMWDLFISEPTLRRISMASACNFAAFSAFWTTLAFLLDNAYHFGPAVVGLFGLVGVAGALGASVAGRVADRYGAAVAQRAALWLTAASFVVYLGAPYSLILLILGVVLMDAGVQAAHLAFQAEVFGLNEGARSRLNGIYMFMRFAGGAAGSILGAYSWHWGQWPGVCCVGIAFSVAAAACIPAAQAQ